MEYKRTAKSCVHLTSKPVKELHLKKLSWHETLALEQNLQCQLFSHCQFEFFFPQKHQSKEILLLPYITHKYTLPPQNKCKFNPEYQKQESKATSYLYIELHDKRWYFQLVRIDDVIQVLNSSQKLNFVFDGSSIDHQEEPSQNPLEEVSVYDVE